MLCRRPVGVTRDAEEAQLGPAVFVAMEVNDVKIAALVDTGSAATIISLTFVLQILADQRDQSLKVEGGDTQVNLTPRSRPEELWRP